MTVGKKNLFIIAGAIAVVVMVAVVGFLLYGEIGTFNEVSGKLDLSKQQLERPYHSNPFPSPENVEREKANVDALNTWFKNLTDDLRKGEMRVPEKNPGTLLKFMQETQKDLIKDAKSHGTALPGGNFLFGFQRYDMGAIPAPTHVPRLTEQLTVIDMISRMLFESGAKELIQVTRREFEEPANQPGHGRQFLSQVAPSASKTPAVKPSEKLYETDHFSFEFKAKEMAIIEFLNRLSKHGVFIAVTSLEIEREGLDVLPAPTSDLDAKALGSPKKTEEQAEQKAPEADAAKPVLVRAKLFPDRDDRQVCGPPLEKPMNVKVELDVYRFPQQDQS